MATAAHGTEHLLSIGRRRIGLITGPRTLLCSRARLDGYRAALESADVAVDDKLIREGDFYQESGFDGGLSLLKQDDMPTAIFASSDQMVFGVYEAVRRHGLRGPMTSASWVSMTFPRCSGHHLRSPRCDSPSPRWANWLRVRCCGSPPRGDREPTGRARHESGRAREHGTAKHGGGIASWPIR